MQVLMRGKKIGVEKLGKARQSSSFLAMPDDVSAIGYIRYLGQELQGKTDLKVGMMVAFGKERQEIKLNGINVFIMEETNVYAIVEDESVETQSSQSA